LGYLKYVRGCCVSVIGGAHFAPLAAPNARRHSRVPKQIGDRASAPIPKFAPFCGTVVCELRNRRTLATYWSNVALVQKSARRTRGNDDADF
jgi:hypothetical protein